MLQHLEFVVSACIGDESAMQGEGERDCRTAGRLTSTAVAIPRSKATHSDKKTIERYGDMVRFAQSQVRWGDTMRLQLALLCTVLAVTGCKSNNLPPAQMLFEPGPGVGGPGPGVMMPGAYGAAAAMSAEAAMAEGMGGPGCMPGPGCMGGGMMAGGMMMGAASSQIAFVGPDGMIVTWDVGQPGYFDSQPLVAPGRSNFPQGAIYRLKLTSIPGRPGVELYPTLELAPTLPRTEAYLAHNAIPAQFTEEDFDQVTSGNFVTKVIYLPDAEFQELALAGVETLVSTRLDPGIDPIVEADRRGSILAIIRLGNKDLQVPDGSGEIPGEIISEEVVPASYNAAMGGPGCVPGDGNTPIPMASSMAVQPAGIPPGFIAGATAPQYGMPISGTPIGLPGPPHIPLGGPAGLQKHTITNHTHVHMPKPTSKLSINVKESPGFSYPKPPSHVSIRERTTKAPLWFRQPLSDKFKFLK